jgi:fatty-acyl-CoA synthase
MTIVGGIVARGAINTPRRMAVAEATGRHVSWSELDERTNRLAHALLGAGLAPGDRVALWGDDVLEFVEAYVALSKAWLVAVPIGKPLTSSEASFILDDVDASAVMFTESTAERLAASLESATVELSALVGVGGARIAGSIGYEQLLSDASASTLRSPAPGINPMSMIGYTSGTTGFPKGVVVRQEGLRNILAMSAQARRLSFRGLGIMTGSLSFPAIIVADLLTLLYSHSSVILPGKWDVDSLLDLCERHRPNYTYVPSPLVRQFSAAALAAPDKLSSLTTIVHGGSKAPAPALRELVEAIGPRFVEIWGMMENSGGPVSATTAADLHNGEADDVFETVGRPLPEVIIKVTDGEAVLPSGPDQVGELLISSPALLSGYWNNEEATAGALHDGWYRSGDLGWVDAAGYVYLIDRRADLIVSGGINIYPSELERVIAQVDGVAEVIVVGVAHERWGRTPVAVVLTGSALPATEAAIVSHCREHLASYKKPSRILFAQELPRTASGKVKRQVLAEWVERSEPGPELLAAPQT